MIKNTPKQVIILGVKVSSTSKDEVLDFVMFRLKKKLKFFITTPNPEIIVKAQTDYKLREALNYSDIALPDGVGLKVKPRITGREMFEELLILSNKLKLKVFLLGAEPKVNNSAVEKIVKDYPNVKIKGRGDIYVNNEGDFDIEMGTKTYIDIIRDINNFKPDLLFVALGAPKQEKWVYKNLKNLKIGGAMVIGGTLDYFTGKMPLPPKFISKSGLEWLWRLTFQPQRVGRIFKAVFIFPLYLTKEKLFGK